LVELDIYIGHDAGGFEEARLAQARHSRRYPLLHKQSLRMD
jgi:hypothetical protein